MMVKINAEQKEVNSTNIANLFEELNVNRLGMVVRINGVPVHWTKYRDTLVQEHDEIEILRFIAGG